MARMYDNYPSKGRRRDEAPVDRGLPLHPMEMKQPLIVRGQFHTRQFGEPNEMVWWAAFGDEGDLVLDLSKDPDLDLNEANDHGATPFYAAVYQNHLDTVTIMVTHLKDKVDVNKPCAGALDATPFWQACARGYAAMVQLLLDFCKGTLDVDGANRHGITPKEAARHNGHDAIVRILEEREAKLEKDRRRSLAGPRSRSLALLTGRSHSLARFTYNSDLDEILKNGILGDN